MQPIYLDHNATTPLAPEAAEVMSRVDRESWGNAASQHAFGRRARRIVEDARDQIADLLGLRQAGREPDRLLFTGGGTEANNLALLGLGYAEQASAAEFAGRVFVSAVEHPSVLGLVPKLRQLGAEVVVVPVDAGGCVDVDHVAERLTPDTRLVSVMLGNNETGVLQPIAELAELCRARNVLLHTDAVQAVGKIELNFAALGPAALSLAAHKFHGPLGVGGLVVRGGVPLRPLLAGGFQQAGLRPGTEPPALIAGMAAALAAWHRERAARERKLRELRDDLERRLTAGAPEIVVHARDLPRLPQTLNAAFLGVDRQAMFVALDQAGVACSTGSACASGSSETSSTLRAMGRPAEQLESSLRFSVGAFTTTAEVAAAAERILHVFNELRGGGKARFSASSGRVAP